LQVGDLMPALKGRFNDSNKNLIALALSLLAKLAKAMGRAIVREARPVLGPALRCLCDSKPFVSSSFAYHAVLSGNCTLSRIG
jgi:cytoskeleton-associated protein 5